MAGIGTKRKEIYKYEAPWTLYSMNWSVRPDRRFRLAVGSFVEEYNNKVYSSSVRRGDVTVLAYTRFQTESDGLISVGHNFGLSPSV